MSAQLIIIKLAAELAAERINQDIHTVETFIKHQKVIKLELWITVKDGPMGLTGPDRLNGLVVTTLENQYYIKVDSESLIPIAKYYKLYTKDFRDAFDRYYRDQCCLLF